MIAAPLVMDRCEVSRRELILIVQGDNDDDRNSQKQTQHTLQPAQGQYNETILQRMHDESSALVDCAGRQRRQPQLAEPDAVCAAAGAGAVQRDCVQGYRPGPCLRSHTRPEGKSVSCRLTL